MKHVITLLSILSLSLSVRCASTADTLRILSTRITTYKAIQKDTVWTTGAVVSNILFSRYDAQGRRKTDNVINPEGTAKQRKLYLYDAQERLYTLASDLPRLFNNSQKIDEEKRVDLTYDAFGNWKKRIKFVNNLPVVYEERVYTYD